MARLSRLFRFDNEIRSKMATTSETCSFLIDYTMLTPELGKWRSAELSRTDETSLRYYLCYGSVRLACVNDVPYNLTLELPLIDFGLGLALIAKQIVTSKSEYYHCTESDDWLSFGLDVSEITAKNNANSWTCRVSLADFRASIQQYGLKLYSDLCAENPAFVDHPVLLGLITSTE
jgi:hypothetical protein